MPSGGKSMTAQRTRQLDGGACGLDQLPSRASASTGQWPQLDLGRLPAPSIARRWQAAHSRTTASRARPRTAAPKTRQYLAFAPARAASGLIRSRPRQRQTLDRGASGKLPTCARRHVRTASTASRAWRRQASSRHRAAMLSTCPVGPARSKNLAATAHTAQPHNHHAAPTAICPASCGKKPRWLVVCGALAWRVLSQRSLSHNVLGRPRAALHRLCGPTLPAPQRSSYLCDWAVTVQLAPTQPQPADRLTPLGSLLKPQPTSPHPRHLREELGPQLCSRHCAVSSWLQTLIRYSCLNLNACEDAICRADKPKMPLLAQFPTLFSLDCIYLPPPTSSIRRNKLRGRPMPRARDRKKPEAPFSWPRARLRGKEFAVAWALIVCEPPFPFDF